MSRHTIRLGSTISFDAEKEADIIKKIEMLTSRHMLGEFISNLLRVAFESPDKLESQEKLNKALREVTEFGMMGDRYKFFNETSKTIEKLKNRVDEMYDMNLKLLCLAQFGKHMGIEPKTNNSLMAQFVLEQQLTELSDKLGIAHMRHVYNSNKLIDAQEKAGDIFKYIIETYDNIVKEMQQTVLKPGEFAIAMPSVGTAVNEEDNTDKVSPVPFEESEEGEQEVVDFGEADLASLTDFLGI